MAYNSLVIFYAASKVRYIIFKICTITYRHFPESSRQIYINCLLLYYCNNVFHNAATCYILYSVLSTSYKMGCEIWVFTGCCDVFYILGGNERKPNQCKPRPRLWRHSGRGRWSFHFLVKEMCDPTQWTLFIQLYEWVPGFRQWRALVYE